MLSAIAVALIAILAVGCGGNGDSGEMNRLVPEGSTLIWDVDLAAVLADLDLELLFDALPVEEGGFASFLYLFEGAQLKTGIKFRDVTNVEFFGYAAESSEYFGVVVYGEFDETAVVAQISANGDGPLASDAYKGYDIHTPQNDQPAK